MKQPNTLASFDFHRLCRILSDQADYTWLVDFYAGLNKLTTDVLLDLIYI